MSINQIAPIISTEMKPAGNLYFFYFFGARLSQPQRLARVSRAAGEDTRAPFKLRRCLFPGDYVFDGQSVNTACFCHPASAAVPARVNLKIFPAKQAGETPALLGSRSRKSRSRK
jgi:hypothetical protein